MRTFLPRTVVAAIAGVLVLSSVAMANPPSLYTRLGGYDAIAAVTKDLAGRLVADPKLGRFWAHRGKDGIEREVQLIVDFIAHEAGGPLYYRGREMKLSHVGMRIDEEDWTALMRHLSATLEKFQVPDAERKDVVAFIESTKKDIVEVK